MEEINVRKLECEGGRPVVRSPGGLAYPVPYHGKVGQHLALLPKEFDPETDDVIVVKKDARRLYMQTVGQDRDSTGLFMSMPEWSPAGWTGDFRHTSTLISRELADQDVVEFVAVCTHRPPEPEKPVGNIETPEEEAARKAFVFDEAAFARAEAELTDTERDELEYALDYVRAPVDVKSQETRQEWAVARDEVLKRYPDAVCSHGGGMYGIHLGCGFVWDGDDSRRAWQKAYELICKDEANAAESGAFGFVLNVGSRW